MKTLDLLIPPEVRAAYARLKDKGFEAYLVGGCVRDLVLGKEPKDWDTTTNATPERTQKLFKDTFYENKFLYHLWRSICSDIPVFRFFSEDEVTHTPTDQVCFEALIFQTRVCRSDLWRYQKVERFHSGIVSRMMVVCPRSSMDRASDFGSEGCGFESCRGRSSHDYPQGPIMRRLVVLVWFSKKQRS